MSKRMISALLAACLSLTLLPTGALAATMDPEDLMAQTEQEVMESDSVPYSTTGEYAYPVNGGNIYFKPSTGEIVDCDSSVTSAVIPSDIDGVKVTGIGDNAFKWCGNLTSITISNGVTSIGGSAFYSCSGLTSITLPESLTSIESSAFYSCSVLTSITIPNSVTSIGVHTFNGCKGLTSITLSDNLTSIADNAFKGCSGLTSITIPNSVTSIGAQAFEFCSGLTSITLSDKLTSIGNSAFYGCSGLTSITIPDSVTSIGERAFYGCKGLTSITLSANLTSIGDAAFYECSGLTSITIPNGVTSIGASAFYRCKGLTSITLSANLTSIGATAFYSCSGLTSITIPNSVTSIGNSAFYECSSLPSITIPESVTIIEERTFYGCKSLTSIDIPNGVTWIGKYAFYGCSSLPSIKLPNNVTWIWEYAFARCSGLTSISIPNGVTSIDYRTFEGCSSLTSISIPASVTSISREAFSSCKKLTDVYYGGTEEDWDKISIGSVNDYLTKATIHCNSSGIPDIPDTPKTFTVTFNANGGTVSTDNKTVTNGGTYGDLPTPTRSNYKFDGWFTAATGGTQVTSNMTVNLTANQTLYAHWTSATASSYTVTFNPNGGTVSTDNKTVTNGGTYGTLPTPTRSNYKFDGWFTSATGGTKIESTTSVNLTANQTLYAHWSSATASSYKVTFNPNGGTVSTTSKTVTNGEPYGQLPEPTRSNYKFDGWFTAATGGTQIRTSTSVELTADQTLYAHWSDPSSTSGWQYFSFSNSTSNFFKDGETQNYNAGSYFDYFKTALLNLEYSEESAEGYMSILRTKQANSWNGSCYGFAAVEGLVNNNMLSPSLIENGKNDLPSISFPRDNTQVRALINYYYLTQFIPKMRLSPYLTNTDDAKITLASIGESVSEGTPCMFCYYFYEGGTMHGHAIILDGGVKTEYGYELIGQDNRFHGCTVYDYEKGEDTKEPVTVTVSIIGSSCTVSLPQTYYTRDGKNIYSTKISETVTSFEPIRNFSKFELVNPTGESIPPSGEITPSNDNTVLYYEPNGQEPNFTLSYGETSTSISDLEGSQNFWYTIGSDSNPTPAAEESEDLALQTSAAGIMAVLDSTSAQTYTITDLSGTVSFVDAGGFASVSATNAQKTTIDTSNNSVTVEGGQGDFSVSVSSATQPLTTVAGTIAETDQSTISVSSTDSGISFDVPQGDYTVTYMDQNDQPITTPITSTGGNIQVTDRQPTVCNDYKSDYHAGIAWSDDTSFTLTLKPNQRSTTKPLDTVTAWQAVYDAKGKMTQIVQLETSSTDDGSLSFSGSALDKENCKLFVLDQNSAPVIEKFSLN